MLKDCKVSYISGPPPAKVLVDIVEPQSTSKINLALAVYPKGFAVCLGNDCPEGNDGRAVSERQQCD